MRDSSPRRRSMLSVVCLLAPVMVANGTALATFTMTGSVPLTSSGNHHGIAFDGYIGERWNRFFIIIEKDLRQAAKVSVGDKLEMIVQPTPSPGALAKALEQSKVTTQPKTPRSDAISAPIHFEK